MHFRGDSREQHDLACTFAEIPADNTISQSKPGGCRSISRRRGPAPPCVPSSLTRQDNDTIFIYNLRIQLYYSKKLSVKNRGLGIARLNS